MIHEDYASGPGSVSPEGIWRVRSGKSWMRRGAFWVVMVAVLGLAQVASADTSSRLSDIGEDLRGLEDRVKGLEARYINPALLERRYEVESRINEGLNFFLLKDYTRASVVFLDLVDDPRIKGKPAGRDALYYLAECLFFKGNYIGARRHFNELLAVGASDYYEPAVGRLIEIATSMEDHRNIENLYRAARARSGGALSPKLTYVYAKSQFFRENDGEAERSFSQVPGTSELYLQSLYFRGVIKSKRGAKKIEQSRRKSETARKEARTSANKDLDVALGHFQKIIELVGPKAKDDIVAELVELTRMAMGRVYYEKEQYKEAINEYQYIVRGSSYYDRSLFEIVWTFIKREEIKLAQNNLDVLLLLEPDSALAPEAQLLRGDLQLQLEAYGEAVETYQDVIDEYEPVRARLREIVQRRGGAKDYFDALVGRDMQQARSVEVPSIVASWVNRDPRMARNLTIAQDLDNSQRDIKASREIIEELEDAINSRSKIDIFPELKEGWGSGLEVKSRYLELELEMLDMERKLVIKSVGSNDKYRQAYEIRKQLEKRFAQVPKNREALAKREKRVKSKYGSLQTEVYRLGYEIDSMRAQLVAMDKYMQDVKQNKGKNKISASEEATVRESMEELYGYISELEEERQSLRKSVRRRRTQTGINDDVAEQEEDLKKELATAISRERRLLAEARGGQSSQTLSQLDSLQSKIDNQEQRLGTYFVKLEKIVNRRVAEIRRELDTERIRVLQYAEELNLYSGDSESLAGDIAQNNFRSVEEKFNELILKADVGIIDVAWKRKDDRSTRIRALFESKGRDLKTLEQNFEGVLEDESQ